MNIQSITLNLPKDAPEWLTRLRTGRYVSPSGVESYFLFDDLSRTRSKKSSSHEIADSNVTIAQDLGSTLHVFSMSVYFVGTFCDTAADKFYDSLFEKYTPDRPGVLNHPRWGDRNVIPFGDPAQNETYTTGGGISRVTVEFRETTSINVIASFGKKTSAVIVESKKARSAFLARALSIAKSGIKAYSKFKNYVMGKVNTIKAVIDGVTGLIDSVRSEVQSIHGGIIAALLVADSPEQVLAQICDLLEEVCLTGQDSSRLATALRETSKALVEQFSSDLFDVKTSDDVKDLGNTYQAFASACVYASSVAALNVEYTTRDQVGDAIDGVIELHDDYSAQLAAIAATTTDGVTGQFIPDTDVETLISGIVYDTIAILLSRSFSLKSRRVYTLEHNSDPMTECWTRYGDLDQLEFFCQTNHLARNEFVELPAGSQVVVYE